jgi:DNA-binding transcriptional LysR family regulator
MEYMEKLDNLSIGAFRLLTVVSEQGSLTRAAKILETSQPQLSKALSKLRSVLDDRLFVRSGHLLRPTARAAEIVALARPILEAAARLAAPPAFDPSTSVRVFSLSVSDTGTARLAPDLYRRMRHDAPHVRVSIRQPDEDDLLKALESGAVDLAVGPFPELVQGIRRRRLFPATYKVLAQPGHPFLRDQSLSSFRASDHVLVDLRGGSAHAHAKVSRLIEESIPQERIALRISGFISAAMVVKQTNLLATVPTFQAVVLSEELGLAAVNCPLNLPSVEIAQFWHERFDRDSGHVWLRRLVYETMKKAATRRPGERR